MPGTIGAIDLVKIEGSRITPAFAKAKTGIIRKVTQGCKACSILSIKG
jgi:hypothetical protein